MTPTAARGSDLAWWHSARFRHFQMSTMLLIMKKAFQWLLREICAYPDVRQGFTEIRWQSMALLTLQEAAEMFIIGLLDNANLCPFHGRSYIDAKRYLVGKVNLRWLCCYLKAKKKRDVDRKRWEELERQEEVKWRENQGLGKKIQSWL